MFVHFTFNATLSQDEYKHSCVSVFLPHGISESPSGIFPENSQRLENTAHGNVLQVASGRGHEKVMQILLNRGADVNARGGQYGSALYAVSVRSCKKIVQILYDKMSSH